MGAALVGGQGAAGQESSRGDRRSFLEVFVGAKYEADLTATK
jgi:hypothetical protein